MSDARAIAPTLRQRIENDPWSKALGIEFLDLRRGHCKVRLQLQAHMVNFQDQPHGGVIFFLADVAFGAACNSHGRDAVALSVTINYLAAAVPDAAWSPRRARSRRDGEPASIASTSPPRTGA